MMWVVMLIDVGEDYLMWVEVIFVLFDEVDYLVWGLLELWGVLWVVLFMSFGVCEIILLMLGF